MQALNAGCLGQSFALTRCCDSREKKPRRRKTKEERRSMVESFIMKYRTKHNGDFPSLNLTHKEVGGSFYTVREIIRDIIQENKVLGPGSASLKSLSLEDCWEEHATDCHNISLESESSILSITQPVGNEQIEFSSELKSKLSISSMTQPDDNEHIEFSSKLESELSISSMTQPVDSEQIEFSSQSNKYDKRESFQLLTPNQEGSDQCDFSFLKNIYPKTSSYLQQNSDSANQHQKMFTAELKEENLSTKSSQIHNSGTYEQTETKVFGGSESCSVDKVEQPCPFSQSVSIASPLKKMALNNKDTRSNDHSFANVTDDNTELHADYPTTGADMFPEMKISFSSLSNDMSNQLTNGSVTCDKEVSYLESYSTRTYISDLHPLESDDLNGSEELSGIKPLAAEMPLPTSATDNTPIIEKAKETGYFSGELLLPNLKETLKVELKAEHALGDSNDNGGLINRKLPENANKEIQMGENILLWRAIKSFVDSFIKFWME